MTDEMEIIRASGNIYRDFELPNAGLSRARASIAATIIRHLDARKLSTRDAENLTGVAHSEFSRIRNAQRRRFTLDRLIAILRKLDENIEVQVSFKTRRQAKPPAPRCIRHRRDWLVPRSTISRSISPSPTRG